MSRSSARIAIFLAGFAVRLYFFSGFVQTDDAHYSLAAFQLAGGGGLTQANQFGTRLGLLAPTALAYKLFGVSLWATVWFPFLCSLGALACVERIVRRHWNESTALYAMALFAFFPLDVLYASRMFPCSPLAFAAVMLLGLLLEDGGPRTVFLAGLTLGAAAWLRMTALFALGPIVLGALLLDLPRRRHCLWGAAGLALAGGLDAAAFWFLTDDPLYRIHAVTGALSAQGAAEGLTTGFDLRFWIAPWTRIFTEQEFGFYPLLILPAVVLSAFRSGHRKERFLALFTAFLFLYSVYGTVAPWRYAPLPRLPRYLSMVGVSGVMLGAVWLLRVARPWRIAVVASLAISSIGFCALDNGRSVALPARAAAAYLSSLGDQRLAVHADLVPSLLFEWSYRPPPNVSFIDEEESPAGLWVLAGLAPTLARNTLDADLWVGRAADLPLPRREPVARFPPADRLYYRLLRDPLFMRFYGLVRDPYRVAGMGRVTSAAIVVVPIDGSENDEE